MAVIFHRAGLVNSRCVVGSSEKFILRVFAREHSKYSSFTGNSRHACSMTVRVPTYIGTHRDEERSASFVPGAALAGHVGAEASGSLGVIKAPSISNEVFGIVSSLISAAQCTLYSCAHICMSYCSITKACEWLNRLRKPMGKDLHVG